MAFERALSILNETFGFEAFRPGQEEAVRLVLQGQDVLAVMPTGAGKSLCFQVPALVHDGLTVVISPLVALMENQVSLLRLNGVRAGSINSSFSREENVQTWQQVVAGEINLLYLSPERLMTGRMIAALRKLQPVLFAIDEAHCISQWGPAFRPEYDQLSALKHEFPDTPLIALTATADPSTRADINAKIFQGQAEEIITGFDRPNLFLTVEMKRSWKQQLLSFMKEHRGEAGIIYCLSRRKTEEVAELLRDEGYKAYAYHAGMSAEDRSTNQDIFMTEPAVVMVATIAFGMGIDKPDIRFVFHTDLPASPEAYYQEIGRAGRDGQDSIVHMLYGMDDIRMRRSFIEDEASDDDRKRREHQRLNSLLAYCETASCRRAALLQYFGEEGEACGACDTCVTPVETAEGQEVGQIALSAIYRTGQVFGTGHVINVIIGKETDKIIDFGHDRLPTFGRGSEIKQDVWKSILRQLLAAGFIDVDMEGYGALKITPKGYRLLKGEEDFRYRIDIVKKKEKTRRTENAAAEATLDERQGELLQRLKELRLELAQERDVPAYIIFSDKTLIDMAMKAPRDERSFGDVFGVGQSKKDAFAEPFLAAIQAFREAG